MAEQPGSELDQPVGRQRKTPKRNVKYVLLARHGKVARDAYIPDRLQTLDTVGVKDTRDVGRALVDQLVMIPERDPISLRCIWHGTFSHTLQTASLLKSMFRVHGYPVHIESRERLLDPDIFWPQRSEQRGRISRVGSPDGDEDEPHRSLARRLRGQHVDIGGGNAVLIIGHQPQLSWIGEELGCKNLPISRSEIVCLALGTSWWGGRNGRLLWTIAPTDNATSRVIREKIKSKMDLAKVFGSVLAAVLGITLGTLLDANKLETLRETMGDRSTYTAYGAGGVFLLGTTFYLATVVAYDRLLMPSRFWAESARMKSPRWLVRRPPSSETYVLYQNMMRIWYFLFLPATWMLIIGLLLLGSIFVPVERLPIAMPVAIGVVIAVTYIVRMGTPRLGAQD